MTTKYQVRATYYKHNSGRGDNGEYEWKNSYADLKSAQAIYNEIKSHLKDGKWAWEKYSMDGYFTRIDGIYEITERKLPKI